MGNRKLDAEDEAILRDYVKHLPMIMEWTKEVHRMTGVEMIEMGFVEHEDNKIDPEGNYLYNMPVQVAANHYRRLKRAWIRDGQEGLTKYLKDVVNAYNEYKNANTES